jgi:hypothetical protein
MKVSNKKKSTISKVSNANTNVTSSCGSLTAGSFNSITGGTTNTWISYDTLPKVEITLLGKSFSVYKDSDILHIYSLIDFLGIEYYKSLKNMKLEHRLDEEIRDFLELESQIFERGQKIKKVIGTND